MERFIDQLKKFSMDQEKIESVLLVGSYARGTDTEASDLDLCIITPAKQAFVENPTFVKTFGAVQNMQTEFYGACTSIRVWYQNGLEVEFGIVEPSWIGRPLDCGTQRVLKDGYQILVDKKCDLRDLPFPPVSRK